MDERGVEEAGEFRVELDDGYAEIAGDGLFVVYQDGGGSVVLIADDLRRLLEVG